MLQQGNHLTEISFRGISGGKSQAFSAVDKFAHCRVANLQPRGDMLKNPGRRLLSLTGRSPQNICVQCQIRLQHSVPAETASEVDNTVEYSEGEPRQDGPRRSGRRATHHPARSPRTYVSRSENTPLPKFNFMNATRARPQFPDRRPIGNQEEEKPSRIPVDMERDIDRVTEVLEHTYGNLILGH